MSPTLQLTEQLIARPSVTPDDAGCQALLTERLLPLGFACETLASGPDDFRVNNLWALRTARDLPSPFRLFVNVVPASMYDPDFQGTSLIRLLEGYGLSPERIALEVSEQYAIKNYTLFVEALQNFTQMGFSIAVDDIGAGYSGLEKIAHLNPRYLKFDMQLVRDIDRSHVKREMARALKTFADKMDSQIIAEGIEREGERQACIDLGIDFGQGYLLARPAPLDTFNLGAAEPSSVPG